MEATVRRVQLAAAGGVFIYVNTPDGVGPGDTFRLTLLPSGRQFRIRVPPNHTPGMRLRVELGKTSSDGLVLAGYKPKQIEDMREAHDGEKQYKIMWVAQGKDPGFDWLPEEEIRNDSSFQRMLEEWERLVDRQVERSSARRRRERAARRGAARECGREVSGEAAPPKRPPVSSGERKRKRKRKREETEPAREAKKDKSKPAAGRRRGGGASEPVGPDSDSGDDNEYTKVRRGALARVKEPPSERLDDLVLPDRITRRLKLQYIKPIEHRTPASSAGLLLYGPPGTGKTTLAKALAGEMGTSFLELRASEVRSKYYGNSEKAIKAVFEVAFEKAPCVLFLDECDSLTAVGQGGDGGCNIALEIQSALDPEVSRRRHTYRKQASDTPIPLLPPPLSLSTPLPSHRHASASMSSSLAPPTISTTSPLPFATDFCRLRSPTLHRSRNWRCSKRSRRRQSPPTAGSRSATTRSVS
jgi:hypothetical protein